MSQPSTQAPDLPAQRVPAPTTAAGSDTPPTLDPTPWPALSKGECVLLAIALHRVARARALGE